MPGPRPDQRFAASAARLLDVLALGVLGLVILSSVARPLFHWDSWAYHLPFSALLLNIGGARESFVLSEEMGWRYEGFPLAAEFLQGVLWRLTGTINATTLINSLGLAAFVVVASRALRANTAILAFGSLSSPLVMLHATSNYIDLFVGASVAFQALAAVRIEEEVRAGSSANLFRWCAAFVASAAVAGNSKLTGPALTWAITAFLTAFLLIPGRTLPRPRRAALVATVTLAFVLSGGTLFRNAMLFANPFYPVDGAVAGVHFTGPEPAYHDVPGYTALAGPLSRPANWLLSITEVDWLVTQRDAVYTLDQYSEDGFPRTGGHRGILVVGILAAAAVLVWRTARRNPVEFANRRFLLLLFVFTSVLTAFMPQSHELRYWLHWPLLALVVVAVFVRTAGLRPIAECAFAAAFLVAFVLSQRALGWPLRIDPILTPVPMMVAGETVEVIRSQRAVCLGPEFNPRQFAYSAVFHGGEYVVEQGWTRCDRFPAVRLDGTPGER